MTSYERKGERPSGGRFDGFDHIEFYVSNAKQVASYYVLRFGFEPYAYRGLETKSREVATHVVKQGRCLLAFTSPLRPMENSIGHQIMITGDAAKDVAFTVEDCKAIYAKAIERGAVSVMAPTELKDQFGTVIKATIKTYGDTVHSFVQRNNYTGVFMPGFVAVNPSDPLSRLLPPPGVARIDHVVSNQPELAMKEVCDWYERVLEFHRFWSVDDSQIHTQYSALRSTVMTDWDGTVKLPVNEPARGLKKSQIQEYVDWHGGPGVQHIALRVPDLITAVTVLKARGVDFLGVPKSYYADVRKRLRRSPVEVKESIDKLEELSILIDFDDQGYLLQLFTKPVEDRPTLFYEFIQRENHEGFGAGNFKSLFEAIERDQSLRGNLDNTPTPTTVNSSGSGSGSSSSSSSSSSTQLPPATHCDTTPEFKTAY